MTVHEGFVALIKFLEQYYETTRADEIGALLGGLSLLPDGDPIDPGYKQEWLEAVQRVKAQQ